MGPTVTLTFAGDANKLEKAFGRVGDSAKGMAGDVDKASDDIKRSGRSLDSLGETADGAEGKFRGFADIFSGGMDAMRALGDESLTTGERLQLLGQAGADIAGGLAGFLIPAISSLGTALKTSVIPAVWGFTTALLANPITWIVIGVLALIAAIVLLVTHFDTVKQIAGDVVSWLADRWNWIAGVLGGVASSIGDAFVGAWNWIRDTVSGVVDWFSRLPGRIGGFFTAIGDGIRNAFRSAFNFVANIWNSTIGSIGFTIPDWVPFVGGKRFGVPKIPTFHTGGVVPGAPGTETLALLQAGERVTPANRADDGQRVEIVFAGGTDSAFASAFMKLVRTGQIQIKAA